VSTSEQLLLEFDHRPSMSGDDFLVSACNAEAVAWLDRWLEWPAPFVVIYGEAGCGKSPLAEVFRLATQARTLVLSTDPYETMDGEHVGIIEDVDRLIEGAQNELFHLYNYAKENNTQILMTARTPPAQWNISLADLKSRMGAVPVVEIGQPDDALIEAVLVKLSSDRQLRIERSVVTYMMGRMERSFEAAQRLIKAIDDEALASSRKITIALVRSVLQDQS